MKKQLFSLALSILLGVGVAVAGPQTSDPAAQGQTAQGSGQDERHRFDPDRQLKALSKRLNLTPDQQNQILPILTDRANQMRTIQSDSSLTPKDRHAKMRSLREDSDKKIKALLTDDQKQAFDQMQQQMRERAKHRRESNS